MSMQTENSIMIQAPEDLIYGLAVDVERWPALLPHYRRVRVLSEDGPRRVVEMAAWRDGIPLRWWAEQVSFPAEPRITFRHVRGVTAGMEVAWNFQASPAGVLVQIRHDLLLNWPVAGGLVADRIIGPLFVSNIAGKTLSQIKLLAEAAQATPALALRFEANDNGPGGHNA
jgi:uncharacterized membrane protein